VKNLYQYFSTNKDKFLIVLKIFLYCLIFPFMGYKKFKVGRDAETGEFITVEEARRRRKTAVVETIKKRT